MRLMNWGGKGEIDWPIKNIYAVKKCLFIYARKYRPLRKGEALFFPCYYMIIAFIVILFFYLAPFYISRQISKIIVNTVNCMFHRRSRANMLIKFAKRCNPFVVYPYSSPSIFSKRFVFRVKASLLYTLPDFIFRKFRFAMCEVANYCLFFAKASTTFNTTGTQIRSSDNSNISARALAFPACISVFVYVGSPVYNSKSVKGLTNKIVDFRHKVISWLKILVDDVCWQTVNQLPLFGSYPSQQLFVADVGRGVN